jgi:Hemerythrin HHE cation binding domain
MTSPVTDPCSRPETPFRLISNTGASLMPKVPNDHYCIKNAQVMAMTHNTFFRALNAIYQQAPHIIPGIQQAADFLNYCCIAYEFIHHQQLGEEHIFFPEIEKATGIAGLMDANMAQHHTMEAGLEVFCKYVEGTRKEDFNGGELRRIINDFAPTFEQHNHDEIQTILNLHHRIESKALKGIATKFWKEAEKQSDIFK